MLNIHCLPLLDYHESVNTWNSILMNVFLCLQLSVCYLSLLLVMCRYVECFVEMLLCVYFISILLFCTEIKWRWLASRLECWCCENAAGVMCVIAL